MKKKIVAIIPARMSASRFPGKPLHPILGLSMIEHVRRRAIKSGLFDEVHVATCDTEIVDEVKRFGGSAIMTKNTHERCTDRIEEAAGKVSADIIVNIQGDEPLVSYESLEKLIRPFLENPETKSTNIINPVQTQEELDSLNVVKAVLSTNASILYLSRAAIPGGRYNPETKYFKQTGLMAFEKNFLHLYSTLAPTPLEHKESCDMLRLLENNYSIQGVLCTRKTIGVDVPSQVADVEKFILNDPEQKAIFDSIANW